MLWRRPREPNDRDDFSVSNSDLLKGVRALALDASSVQDPQGEASSDVMVVCSDGRELPAFRALLAASSEPFKAMFRYGMRVRSHLPLQLCS